MASVSLWGWACCHDPGVPDICTHRLWRLFLPAQPCRVECSPPTKLSDSLSLDIFIITREFPASSANSSLSMGHLRVKRMVPSKLDAVNVVQRRRRPDPYSLSGAITAQCRAPNQASDQPGFVHLDSMSPTRSMALHVACESCVFSTLQGSVTGAPHQEEQLRAGGEQRADAPLPYPGAGEAETGVGEKRGKKGSKRIPELGETPRYPWTRERGGCGEHR